MKAPELGSALRPSTIRDANCELVVKVLEQVGPSTRAMLSSATSLTPQALGSIMNALIKVGLVRISDSEIAGRGRPSAIYQVEPTSGYWLGMSIQWRSILLALRDASGSIVARDRVEHDGSSMKQVIQAAVSSSRRLVASVPNGLQNIRSVGLSVQGHVDRSASLAVRADAWPEENMNPAAHVFGATGWPTSFESSARSTALAEIARHPSGLVAVLYFSHDPSLVLVHDGRIVDGGRGLGGSFAHLRVPGARTRCECGQVGCMTTVASGSALVRQYVEHSNRPASRAPDVVKAAQDGDPEAKAALATFGEITAKMAAQVLAFIDPSVIVISGYAGGPTSRGATNFAASLRAHLAESAQFDHVRIELSPFGEDAHVYGALALARSASGLWSPSLGAANAIGA